MREARVRELASWNRSGARSPRTFVPDPRGGLLDARDAPYRAERRHETDEERDAGALDHEHEHSTPSRTRALASALTRPDECDALARRHDPATAPISFGIGQEVHVSFEVLDATTMRCSTRRHQERGPDDAQSNQQQKPVDSRSAVVRLRRVVQGEGRDGRGRERLHLDAGPVSSVHRRSNGDPTSLRFWRHDDLRARHRDGMTKRQQFGRPLQTHHAGDSRSLQWIPLRRACDETLARLRRHGDHALRHGYAIGDFLPADLDDPRDVRRPCLLGCTRAVHHSSIERNRITRTSLPALAVATPGGINARPFARETVAMRFDPRPPVGVATQPSRVRFTRTRANCVLPFGPVTSSARRAVTSGRNRFRRPIIFISEGRMKTSKLTNTLTGFPGRPKYGFPSM